MFDTALTLSHIKYADGHSATLQHHGITT